MAHADLVPCGQGLRRSNDFVGGFHRFACTGRANPFAVVVPVVLYWATVLQRFPLFGKIVSKLRTKYV